jgi:hypothetical protein
MRGASCTALSRHCIPDAVLDRAESALCRAESNPAAACATTFGRFPACVALGHPSLPPPGGTGKTLAPELEARRPAGAALRVERVDVSCRRCSDVPLLTATGCWAFSLRDRSSGTDGGLTRARRSQSRPSAGLCAHGSPAWCNGSHGCDAHYPRWATDFLDPCGYAAGRRRLAMRHNDA